MSNHLEQAAEALRRAARKPGLPAPTKQHQDKERHVALRKLTLAVRKEER